MLDSTINKMKSNNLNTLSYDMSHLLDDILNNIKNNIDVLKESYKYEYNEDLKEDILYKTFNIIESNNETYKNELGLVTNSFSPYGIVGIVIKNDISFYNFADIINLIIQSKNSCIIDLYKPIGTQNILIEIINQVLSDYKINIIELQNDIELNDNFDLLIYIGDKKDFNNLKTNCEKRFYGIGKYELIVDYILDNKLIDEAQKQNVKITFKNNDKHFYDIYNKSSNNYCVSLMTNNKEEARRFLKNMKASFLLVNIIPTLENRINIDFNDLVYKKSSIVYEE